MFKKYNGINKVWLKFCCLIGWHHWVYPQNEAFRTCKHPWCAAHEERRHARRPW